MNWKKVNPVAELNRKRILKTKYVSRLGSFSLSSRAVLADNDNREQLNGVHKNPDTYVECQLA